MQKYLVLQPILNDMQSLLVTIENKTKEFIQAEYDVTLEMIDLVPTKKEFEGDITLVAFLCFVRLKPTHRSFAID